MSRHRHVQKLNYDEEYDEAYDEEVYGRSVDEHDFGVSPSGEDYLYRQDRSNYGIGAYFAEEKIAEESEDRENVETERRSSTSSVRPRLSSEDEARVNSVLDEVRNVVGDEFSDSDMVRAVIANNYNFEETLDSLLNSHTVKQGTKPTNSSTLTSKLPIPDYLYDTLNVSYMTPISHSLSSAFIFDNNVRERVPTRKIAKEWYNAVIKNHKKDNLVQSSRVICSIGKYSQGDSSNSTLEDSSLSSLSGLKLGRSVGRNHSFSSDTLIEQSSHDSASEQIPNQQTNCVVGSPADINESKRPFLSSGSQKLLRHNTEPGTGLSSASATHSSLSSLAAAHLSKFNAFSSDAFIIPQFSKKSDLSEGLPPFIVPKTTNEMVTPAWPCFTPLGNADPAKSINSASSSASSKHSSSPHTDNSLTKSFKQMALDNRGAAQGFCIPPLITGCPGDSPYTVSTPKTRNVNRTIESGSGDDIDLTVALLRTKPVVEGDIPSVPIVEAVLSSRPSYSPVCVSFKSMPLSDFGKIVCKAKFRRFKRTIAWSVVKTRFRPFDFKSLCPDELFAAAAANYVPTVVNLRTFKNNK